MKYLKYFEETSAYEAYKNGSDFILPNVSYVVENDVVNYNPFTEAKSGVIMARYNATEENKLAIADTSNVKSLKINGTEVEFADTYYFNEVGEYDVEIELIDPTLINGSTLGEWDYPISNSMFFKNDDEVGACLTSIVIPDSVTTIGNAAFYYCSGLIEGNIGSGVTTIENLAFSECSGLTSIVIPDSVTTIESSAFAWCIGLTSIVIPDSVTTIGNAAFYGCISLSAENNIRYAGRYLSKVADKSLSTYTIKDGTKWIGNSAFEGCKNLTSIVIPDSVTTIESSVFDSCLSLTEITCNAITAPTIDKNAFGLGGVKTGGVLKVPAGSDYSSWMSADHAYLGKYNWTIEYI